MSKKIEANYSQDYLFPPSLEKLIDEGHPARFIREFVDSLDLEEMGFQTSNDTDEGRPAYSAGLLLKIWLYGLFMKIKSTRTLEYACLDSIGMMWLTGFHEPDHNTIWRFYDKHKDKIGKVFKKTIEFAIKYEMIGLIEHAIDGTRIEANVSRGKTLRKEDLDYIMTHLHEVVAERIKVVEDGMEQERTAEIKLPSKFRNKTYLKALIRSELEQHDLDKESIEEVRQEVKSVLEEKKQELESEGLKEKNITDEDARRMKVGLTKSFAYNAQAVVDDKSKIIVACDVVQDTSDNHQLTRMMDKVKENCDDVAAVTVADAGYFSGEQLQQAEDKEYNVVVALQNEPPQSGEEQGKYHSSNFKYDKEKDVYICPEGKELSYIGLRKRKNKKIKTKVYRCVQYRECPYRDLCSNDKKGRRIQVSPYAEAVDRQRKKQQLEENVLMLAQRREIIEHVFGIIKNVMGFRRWMVRGLENVSALWNYICTVYNLKKIYQQWLQKPKFATKKATVYYEN